MVLEFIFLSRISPKRERERENKRERAKKKKKEEDGEREGETNISEKKEEVKKKLV